MTNSWNPDQSLDELVAIYRKKFIYTHGYNIVYTPSPLTKEWLIDQLHALDWYAKYEINSREQPKIEEPKQKRKKNINPFK